MDGWDDWNWLLGDVDTGKDLGSLGDTGQLGGELLSWQVVELEVDVVLVITDTATGTDLHGGSTRDDVTGGQILGGWGVTLHVSLTLRVDQNATFAAASLGDEATGTVDTSGVELDELQVGVGQTGAADHGHTVTSAGVGRSARLPAATETASGQDGVVGVEAVNGAVLHADGDNTDAVALLVHDEISGEVLDEVGGVVVEGAAVESVEKGVTGSVGDAAASVGLATLTVLEGLATESTLVDFTVGGSGEGHAVVFEFDDGLRGDLGHVVNGVLVTEPIGALDGIVHMVLPVVFLHVTKSGVDTTLGSDCV